MGITGLLLFSATLALAAATSQYNECTQAYIGDISGDNEAIHPLKPSIVPAGTGNFHTPDLVCMIGAKPAGLLVIACSKNQPPPNVEIPDLDQAIVTTQSPAVVDLIVFCKGIPAPPHY